MTTLELIGALSIIIIILYVLHLALVAFVRYANKKQAIRREKEYEIWCDTQEKESWEEFLNRNDLG